LFVLLQQARKYTPSPGTKLTDPLPVETTVPVTPAGAKFGVMTDPFAMPLGSLAVPRMNRRTPAGIVEGTRDTVAVAELDPMDAEITTDSAAVNAPAVAVNAVEIALAETVADGGMVSSGELSLSVTTVPPVGAACERVTVQMVPALGERVAAAHCSAAMRIAGVKEMFAVFAEPFREAVIVTI
jgi:hypothetical protein